MIPIQNIYYMLSYAFQELREGKYRLLTEESFENTGDLLAEILIIGTSKLIKKGIGRSYREKTSSLQKIKGKIEIDKTLRGNCLSKHQLICTYNEYSIDNYENRIIKTTLQNLLKVNISRNRKKRLKHLLIYFQNVKSIEFNKIDWNKGFKLNDQHYRFLISICQMINENLILSEEDKIIQLKDFFDEQRLSKLYEKFILEYFRKEFPEIEVSSPQIDWALDSENRSFLPIMQSDIVLSYNENVLIIDAKYYSHIFQKYFEKSTFHSNNLYQIFAYVKNRASSFVNPASNVSGMLLYAGTDEKIQPDMSYKISGNVISVKTLDLNCDFSQIAKQLNKIALNFMHDIN